MMTWLITTGTIAVAMIIYRSIELATNKNIIPLRLRGFVDRYIRAITSVIVSVLARVKYVLVTIARKTPVIILKIMLDVWVYVLRLLVKMVNLVQGRKEKEAQRVPHTIRDHVKTVRAYRQHLEE